MTPFAKLIESFFGHKIMALPKGTGGDIRKFSPGQNDACLKQNRPADQNISMCDKRMKRFGLRFIKRHGNNNRRINGDYIGRPFSS